MMLTRTIPMKLLLQLQTIAGHMPLQFSGYKRDETGFDEDSEYLLEAGAAA
jgi:hypothetical protein